MVWTGNNPGDYLGRNGAKAAGDLNGDGIDDLMISGYEYTYIYYGGQTLSDVPDMTLLPPVPSADIYGWNVVGNFDFNGDGHSDVAASIRSSTVTEGVFVYFGGPGMDDQYDRVFVSDPDQGLGRVLPGGADVTGDGVDDLLVDAVYASNYDGKVYLLAGEAGPGSILPCSVEDDFEVSASGWGVGLGNTCQTGTFVLGTPSEQRTGGGFLTQVGGDHTTGTGNAFFTAFNTNLHYDDVDKGTCVLESPEWSVADASDLSLWYFHGQRDGGDDGGDFFELEYSADGGVSYQPLVSIGDVRRSAAWTWASTPVSAGSQVRLRLRVSDAPKAGDIIEGGLDDVRICPRN